MNPGSKTLCTRIRVAHNSSLDDMSQLLGQCFEITSMHAGVFRSPLQVSDPVRIGWLLNYPMGIGRAALERELMRHFTSFKRAIALEPAWPQTPSTAGPKAWHIWVAASDVDRKARALFAWLRPETRKCHMPFSARTLFVYDWGAIMKGHLGDLTCTSLAPLFPIQGMLTKVFIPKYCKQGKGKSLLQFLYAIQCIPAVKKPPPAQPEQSATQDADTPDSPLPPSVSSTPPEPTPTNSSVTAPTTAQPTLPAPSTKRSSRKGSKNFRAKQPLEKPTETPQATPPTPLPRPTPALKSTPQSATNPPTESSARAKLSASEQPLVTEAFDRSTWLAAMDAELNQGPAGLFHQMILPGPIDGFYVFVVRQKFASLAQEVLKNLAAFLISHLELWQDLKHQRKTCRTWLCLDHYNRTVTNAMTWDQSQHRAISEYERDVDLDQQVEKDDNEWIEKLLAAEQASPEFEGTITIDLSMPAAKDMDDGLQ
ncbi:unnamed protein product [Cylindrotheca closterium]|uniref:Uncharacterized protein n=1 Tax=Cylindrotheca closterium TaxID=2856 RepID=A0AAD2JIQ8_9STRA|nr:unnamed protein product [Cylindrotheca closterium]